MRGEGARKVEQAVDAAASVVLAAAIALAATKVGLVPLMSLGAGLAAGLLCGRTLSRIDAPSRKLALPRFAAALMPPFAEDAELVLTEAERISGPAELLLDGVAAHVGAESRVVRLFDPAAMPSAGELAARVDRHLGKADVQTAPPDASQALFAALADLRRSLG